MLAQLVEDLLHLERGRVRLDQHGGPDRAARQAQPLLGAQEHVVPQPRLQVALHLGQVEVRPFAAFPLGGGVVEEEEAEVDQGAGHPLAVDDQVLLGQVPAARPDDDGRQLVGRDRVRLAFRRGERQPVADRVVQVELALDDVLPQRGVRVLVVGQPHPGTGVERVDGHLGVGRPGDLHPPVDQAGRRRRHPPVPLPHILGLGEEVQGAAGGQLRLPLGAPAQQLPAARLEGAVQLGEQGQGRAAEHLVVPVPQRSRYLDAGRSVSVSGRGREPQLEPVFV